MNPLATALAENQQYLLAAVAVIRVRLQHYAARSPEEHAESLAALHTAEATELALRQSLSQLSPLDILCLHCGLSSFERALLLLCLGVEIDDKLAATCAATPGASRGSPTFALALATLPQPHWSALLPVAPLRRHMLIQLLGDDSLLQQPLRLEERVLHSLLGLDYLDPRLQSLLQPVELVGELPESQQPSVLQVIHYLRAGYETLGAGSAAADGVAASGQVQLFGQDLGAAVQIAATACAALRHHLYLVHASDLPLAPADREQLLLHWQRESTLGPRALLLHCGDLSASEFGQVARAFCDRVRGPLFIVASEALPLRREEHLRIEVSKPTHHEQLQLWQAQFAALPPEQLPFVSRLVAHFDLGGATIAAVATSALAQTAAEPALPLAQAAWLACRSRARTQLDGLAQRVTPRASWRDLVVPPELERTLRMIAAQVRHRQHVYEEWGLGLQQRRGLGISVLFAGSSGTGKTLAAEVLAHELNLDLYQIDLSQLVSKYIGETEKNLRRVFDAAEAGGAVLLFDEADALFGKRSEVKDSHDRYANIEVSYLLQRMEQYRGLAILTTNLKSALDDAFLRRLRFVVQFPFPDSEQRGVIWRRALPPQLPQHNIDVGRLARLPLTGGNIRNIALNAAFLAADQGLPLNMQHLAEAVHSEYDKLEKPYNPVELGGAP